MKTNNLFVMIWFFAPLAYFILPKNTQTAINSGVKNTINNVTKVFSMPANPGIEFLALNLAKTKLRQSEGDKLTVYLDTRGIPTVGIGHRVLPSDNLKVGQKITPAARDKFFEKDVAIAFNAAKSQAKELGRYTPNFIAALTEVNFQLGTGWKNEFKNTYNALRAGDYRQAISNLEKSAWKKQTPVRVANFIEEIKKVYTV